MNQTNNTLTREEMTEALYLRAEEIFLLCAIITRRGIAHAFCELIAHTGQVHSRVFAADTIYEAGANRTALAEIEENLFVNGFLDTQGRQEQFDELMAKMDTYVSYLDLLIERNQPVLTSQQEGAA